MQIFSGSSNRDLAEKIAKILGTKLGEMEISQFANGETRVWVKEKKIEKSVIVVQSLSSPTNEHLVEFCLICDALQRGGATDIAAVIPWMGYSKQDKVFRVGEPLSAKVVAQIIQTTKIKKLITFDLHNRAIMGFFDIPTIELSAKSIFLEYFRSRITDKMIVVAPDAGSVKSSSNFARELKLPIAYMDKRRDYLTGKVDVMGMSGEVKGQHVVIVDDLIVTGCTIIEAAKYLKAQGALTVTVAATHHLYVPGAQEKLVASDIGEIVVTDTVQPTNGGKLKILSVAQAIVDELQ
jgi:ribose-phosphate pyrophosphokinase